MGAFSDLSGRVRIDEKGTVAWPPFRLTPGGMSPQDKHLDDLLGGSLAKAYMQLGADFIADLAKTNQASLVDGKLVFTLAGSKLRLEYTKYAGGGVGG